MKFSSFLMLSSIGLAAMLSSNGAIAATNNGPASCVCVVNEPASAGAPIGQIVAATGTVYASGATGMQLTAVGAPLSDSTEIQTGPDSSADVQLGSNCDLKIGSSTTITVTPGQDGLCVTEATLQADTSGRINNTVAIGLAGAGAVAVGYGISASISQ